MQKYRYVHFFPVTHFPLVVQHQSCLRSMLSLFQEIRCRTDLHCEQSYPTLSMGMCLKLKSIDNKELAHEKQFKNSLSCSHYAEFQYHPQC